MYFTGDALSHFVVYEEINFICFCVLQILLMHIATNRAHSAVNHAIIISCIPCLVAIISDAVREIFIYRQMMPEMIILFSVLKAVMTLVMLVNWLNFSLLFLNIHLSGKQHFLLNLPAIAAGTAHILSFFGIGTFWAVSPGIYQRGPLFFMESFGFCIYPLIQFLFYMYNFSHTVTRSMKIDYIKMAAFGIFPAAGSLLQLGFGQAIPWISPAIMLAILQGFLSAENREVNVDTLTGIMRRPVMERYLQDLLNAGALSAEEGKEIPG